MSYVCLVCILSFVFVCVRAYVCGLCYLKATTDLAGGYFGCVWGLLGDHDYKRDCLKLPNVNSNHCCPLCPANTADVPWFDFRREAHWLQRCYRKDQVKYPCKLFDIEGVSNLSIMPDWMHDKCLGTDKVHTPC